MARYLKLLWIFLMVAVLIGCATSSSRRAAGESLEELCQQAGVSYVYDPVTRCVRLTKGSKTVSVLVGSDAVWWGDQKILLTEPVQLSKDTVKVPADFKEKVLSVFAGGMGPAVLKKGRLKIMVDPGHGGKDPGAIAYRIQEKEVVLDIARRLEKLLEGYGYDVRMTRSGDQFISLEQRTEMAAQWGADLFISVHANASESKQVKGFEVWAPRALTHEDFREDQRKKNHQIAFNQMNMKKHHHALEKTLEDLFYRYKREQSLKMAAVVSRQCSREALQNNRGVKQSGFFVLRNTLIPSVLVEVGFVSNSREAEQLRTGSYRQQIAEMLAVGIRNYIQSL
ncbi:MAG TPA: N-acetylmuramoyl-L-alanine amidase [Candidatus Bathyarchaeia archaeon]|nr:N-acetylmuramoyl-L-alanine amidase [Candidatus Bathyarchaeia archaeon]